MNPHDKAHELVRTIRESDAFVRASAAKQRIEADESALQMIRDFKRRQMTLQAQQMMGQSPTEEDYSQLQQLGDVIQTNPDAGQYLQADMELQVLVADVHRILTEAVNEVSILSLENILDEMGRTQ